MKRVIKYITIIAIMAFSTILSIDLGNFQYLSNKYRLYFPGKQISVASQQSFSQKAKGFGQTHWPMLAQAACIATGYVVGSIVPEYKIEANTMGAIMGATAGIMGIRSLKESSNKQYRFEYKRYSKEYSDVVKNRQKALPDFNETKLIVDEYNVLSRYPKVQMSFPVVTNGYYLSNMSGVIILSVGSGAWLCREIIKKMEEEHTRMLGEIDRLDAAIRTANPNIFQNTHNAIGNDNNQRLAARRWWQFWRSPV